MADQFTSSGFVYPQGSYYQNLDSRLKSLEQILGTSVGSIPDYSITQYKLSDDAIPNKTNGSTAATALADTDVIPVVRGTALLKLAVSNFFTTGRKWANAVFDAATFRLKNTAGFSTVFNFLGTADRTVTVPDRDVNLADVPVLLFDSGQLATAQASIDVLNVLSTAYSSYEIELIGVWPSVNGASLYLRLSADGGATWITSAAYDYTYIQSAASGNPTTAQAVGTTFMILTGSVGSASITRGACGRAGITLQGSSFKIKGDLTSIDDAGAFRIMSFAGEQYASQPNSMRIFPSSGNISAGSRVRVWGRR